MYWSFIIKLLVKFKTGFKLMWMSVEYHYIWSLTGILKDAVILNLHSSCRSYEKCFGVKHLRCFNKEFL